MKVCFDANVIIDIVGRAHAFPDSFFAYDVANIRHFDAVVTAAMTPTIDYVARQYRDDGFDSSGFVLAMFDVIDVAQSDCTRARSSDMTDYEDALIAQSCLRNGVDVIVTRNPDDYVQSPVAAMTPVQFVEAFKPADYDYANLEFDLR